MKIIHRYIFKELVKIFAITAVSLTLTLCLLKALFLIELIVDFGLSFFDVLLMVVHISPVFFATTLAPSILVASLVVFTRFSSENEFVAMKTSGWSFLYVLRPVFCFSLIIFFLNLFVIFYVIPWGNKAFMNLTRSILKTRTNFDLKPEVFIQDFKDLVIYFKGKDQNSRLKDLFLLSQPRNQSARVILSKEGVITSDPKSGKLILQLKNGTTHEPTQEGEGYQVLKFERYGIKISTPKIEKLQSKFIKSGIKIDEPTIRELLKDIKKREAKGKRAGWQKIFLSRKFAIPFSCLLFGFAGAPLGVCLLRSGKSGNYITGLVTITFYYFCLMLSQRLGSIETINPYFSVWIPNIFLSILSAYLVYNVYKGNYFIFVNRLQESLETAYRFIQERLFRVEIRKPNPPYWASALRERKQ